MGQCPVVEGVAGSQWVSCPNSFVGLPSAVVLIPMPISPIFQGWFFSLLMDYTRTRTLLSRALLLGLARFDV